MDINKTTFKLKGYNILTRKRDTKEKIIMGIFSIKMGIFEYILNNENQAIKQINYLFLHFTNLKELMSQGSELINSLPEENLDIYDTRTIIIVGGILKKTSVYKYFTLDNKLFVGLLSKVKI